MNYKKVYEVYLNDWMSNVCKWAPFCVCMIDERSYMGSSNGIRDRVCSVNISLMKMGCQL